MQFALSQPRGSLVVMELQTSFFLLTVSFFLAVGILLRTRRRRHVNLPPGPLALPIIGHLHLLQAPFHRFLETISKKYGKIISLRLGNKLMVAIAQPSAVEECFTKFDLILANRPRLTSGKYAGYNYTSMSTTSYGDHWRNLRRLGATELFSTKRLNMFGYIRKDEVKAVLLRLARESREGYAKVALAPILGEMTFNNITRIVAGKRYYGGDDDDLKEAEHFQALIKDFIKYGAALANPADFFPFLRWFGVGKNHEKRMERMMSEAEDLLQRLIENHKSKGSTDSDSILEHLLFLQKTDPNYYTDTIIHGFLLVMVLAGTDTSSATMSWVMTLLLNHPEVLKKAKAELEAVVGNDRLPDESDLPKLPYLRSIIFETFRIFPVSPLLVPHVPSEDIRVAGYDIPAGTMVLINVWALHRDPDTWEDPLVFKPERFGGEVHESPRLLPFGLGRRSCPGAPLALRVISLTLASLIHCFEWKRTSDALIETVEAAGVTMPKLDSVEVMCKARDIMKHVH